VTADELDEDVGSLPYSVEEYYSAIPAGADELPAGLDGALKAIFTDLDEPAGAKRLPAAGLIRRLERDLMANVYRWTGHFPERTRHLLRHLAKRAEELQLAYPGGQEVHAAVALTTLVTALAMNHLHKGSYVP
jgi:hypothetical protein